jgi:hypothetical protein
MDSERLVPRYPSGLFRCASPHSCRWPGICAEGRCIDEESADSPHRTTFGTFYPPDLALLDLPRPVWLVTSEIVGTLMVIAFVLYSFFSGMICAALHFWRF